MKQASLQSSFSISLIYRDAARLSLSLFFFFLVFSTPLNKGHSKQSYFAFIFFSIHYDLYFQTFWKTFLKISGYYIYIHIIISFKFTKRKSQCSKANREVTNYRYVALLLYPFVYGWSFICFHILDVIYDAGYTIGSIVNNSAVTMHGVRWH